jgi:crotonobetainyl-CoA:carnitine CoA-transferase CaiB-like acyl-CoA transferase
MVQLSESPGRYGPGVLAGQHTVALLKELGYTEEQITNLKAREVVFWEATDPIGSLR